VLFGKRFGSSLNAYNRMKLSNVLL